MRLLTPEYASPEQVRGEAVTTASDMARIGQISRPPLSNTNSKTLISFSTGGAAPLGGWSRGWILHGLWPQYERGFPRNCQTAQRPPSRSMTAGMADIMGTSGLAWHQWKKHGTCTGLSAAAYYDLSRRAYSTITRPQILRQLSQPVNIAPGLIEDVFIQANPTLTPDSITITCRAGHIQEARICLTKNLTPRRCAEDVIKDCTDKNALLTPIR
jgi:ribonuclease T2